jgi:hypothetical protein
VKNYVTKNRRRKLEVKYGMQKDRTAPFTWSDPEVDRLSATPLQIISNYKAGAIMEAVKSKSSKEDISEEDDELLSLALNRLKVKKK